MSKYIPPNMRNKKVVLEPLVVEKTEEHFPTLVTTNKVTVFATNNGKSFANLASEWASKSEEDKMAEDLKNKEKESIELLRKQYRLAPLPQINNVRHFVEPEDERPDQYRKNEDLNEEGWVEVSHYKTRKQKTFEEKLNRPPTPEEKPDGTVWENNEEADSDWKRR